jgi:hypothetical protein
MAPESGSEEQTDALAALLAEAETAHGAYEASELNGVYDEQWPAWYAAYVVDHGIGAVLGRDVSSDEMAQFLSTAWQEYQAMDPPPAEPWGRFLARQIAGRL